MAGIVPRTTLRQKAGLLFLGLLLFFVSLEAGLRLSGFVIASFQEAGNMSSARNGGQYRILCLGESTTAIGGDESYPAQLEKELNRDSPGMKFSVINRGISGGSSTALRMRLPQDIAKYSPHMVVVMMGVNDADWEWSKVLRPYGPVPASLRQLRVYKLASLLAMGMRSRGDGVHLVPRPIAHAASVSGGTDYYARACLIQDGGDHAAAEEWFRKDLVVNPGRFNSWLKLGWSYECRGMHLKAEECFKQAIALDKGNQHAYRGLGHVYFYQGRFKEAAQMMERVISIYPDDALACLKLAECHMQGKDYPAAARVLLQATSRKGKNDKAYGQLALVYQAMGDYGAAAKCRAMAKRIREEYYNPMTRENYLAIAGLLRQKGIRMVCVQYPMRSVLPLRKLIAADGEAIFVDNEKPFRDAVDKEGYQEYFSDLFAGDFGHCTPKGNRLLAGNIAKAVMQEAQSW